MSHFALVCAFLLSSGGLEAAGTAVQNEKLELKAAPGGATILVRGSGGSLFGTGPAGEELHDVLLTPGQRLAVRGADGRFRDLLLNQGKIGFFSNGTWVEFPAKTAEQVVLAVKASLGFAETGLGKEILKAAGGEGPVPFSTITLASNVKSSQLAMVRGRTLRRVLLEKDQPIKGKGKDGAFRPVQMRNDDRIGYWTPDGWRDFPEATQEEMRLYLEVSGRAR